MASAELKSLVANQVFELLKEPVIAFDEQGRISYANAAHEKFTGRSESELRGNCHQEIFSPNPSDGQFTLPPKKPQQTQLLVKTSSGKQFWVTATVFPIVNPYNSEQLLGGGAIYHLDLATLQAESDNLPADPLPALNQGLRNPLQVLTAGSKLLIERRFQLPRTLVEEQLQAMHQQANAINELLSLSSLLIKLQTGAVGLQPVALDIAALCKAVSEELKAAGQLKGPIPSVTLEEALPPVYIDRQRTKQALGQLFQAATVSLAVDPLPAPCGRPRALMCIKQPINHPAPISPLNKLRLSAVSAFLVSSGGALWQPKEHSQASKPEPEAEPEHTELCLCAHLPLLGSNSPTEEQC